MRATFRPLPSWPYPETAARRAGQFKAGCDATLWDLDYEISRLDGSEIIIGVVVAAQKIRMDGHLYADARPAHPGVELSFESGGRRLVFHTDAYLHWHDNLRGIALSLEALRAVDRYGVTTASGEQYAGFALLEEGPVGRGRRLVDEAGGMDAALRRWHPDHGGNDRAIRDVLAFRESLRS